VEAAGGDVLHPKARYLKVQCGAYKHGFDNQDDPSIGLAELQVYTTEEFRVVRQIDPAASPASYYSYTADYDGDGTVDTWQRNQPGLWARLGGRHRTLLVDKSGELGEHLARDYALDLLAESVRLFSQLTYRAVCDPRIGLYATAAFGARQGADAGSILVERVVLTPRGSEISGTDYLASPPGV
jgi:hypothetical protein